MTNEEFIKSVSYEGEVWKDVPGFEGYYAVSSFGRIMSLGRMKKNRSEVRNSFKEPSLLSLRHLKSGYQTILFCIDSTKTQMLVHRVVATAFLENPDNKPVVDHIDGNKTNNNVTNLRWATFSENNLNINSQNKHTRTCEERGYPIVKLKDGKLLKIYAFLGQLKGDGLSKSQVVLVCDHLAFSHHGYQFMYYDEYNQLLEKDQSLN